MHLVKYPGGKDEEMPQLSHLFPKDIDCFYDPFCGGGAPYFHTEAKRWRINDLSSDLVNLWKRTMCRDEDFENMMEAFAKTWSDTDKLMSSDKAGGKLLDLYVRYRDGIVKEDELSDSIDGVVDGCEADFGFVSRLGFKATPEVFMSVSKRICLRKFKRMKHLEFNKRHISDEDVFANVLGCLKATVYDVARSLYNSSTSMSAHRAMLFYVMRDLCYSSMFRFNANGGFNVPYGGISYNKKSYVGTAETLFGLFDENRVKNTELSCKDWLAALPEDELYDGDFIFLDPPYDGGFSTYDGATFGEAEHRFLASWLINRCKAKFLLDVRVTPLMSELYKDGSVCANGDVLHVTFFDKRYSVSFMDRNAKAAKHMVVTNYVIDELEATDGAD